MNVRRFTDEQLRDRVADPEVDMHTKLEMMMEQGIRKTVVDAGAYGLTAAQLAALEAAPRDEDGWPLMGRPLTYEETSAIQDLDTAHALAAEERVDEFCHGCGHAFQLPCESGWCELCVAPAVGSTVRVMNPVSHFFGDLGRVTRVHDGTVFAATVRADGVPLPFGLSEIERY